MFDFLKCLKNVSNFFVLFHKTLVGFFSRCFLSEQPAILITVFLAKIFEVMSSFAISLV